MFESRMRELSLLHVVATQVSLAKVAMRSFVDKFMLCPLRNLYV